MAKKSDSTKPVESARGLERRTALPAPRPDHGGGPGDDRGAEMGQADEPGGGPDLLAQRPRLHLRDLQARRQDDLRQVASLEDPAGLFNSSLEGNTRGGRSTSARATRWTRRP